jgi:hypothetical protein
LPEDRQGFLPLPRLDQVIRLLEPKRQHIRHGQQSLGDMTHHRRLHLAGRPAGLDPLLNQRLVRRLGEGKSDAVIRAEFLHPARLLIDHRAPHHRLRLSPRPDDQAAPRIRRIPRGQIRPGIARFSRQYQHRPPGRVIQRTLRIGCDRLVQPGQAIIDMPGLERLGSGEIIG